MREILKTKMHYHTPWSHWRLVSQALRYTDKHQHASETSRLLSSALQDCYVTLEHVTLHISIHWKWRKRFKTLHREKFLLGLPWQRQTERKKIITGWNAARGSRTCRWVFKWWRGRLIRRDSVGDEWLYTEHYCNNDKRKPEYLKESLSQCRSVHHKSQTQIGLGTNPELRGERLTNERFSYGRGLLFVLCYIRTATAHLIYVRFYRNNGRWLT
jgi:hypothetical protein